MMKKNWTNKRKIDCCWVAVVLSIAVVVVVALFLGYTVKISHQQIILKNQEENHHLKIRELEKEVQELKEKIKK